MKSTSRPATGLTTAKLRERFVGGTVNEITHVSDGHSTWLRGPINDIRIKGQRTNERWLDVATGIPEILRGPDDWFKIPYDPVLGKNQWHVLSKLVGFRVIEGRNGRMLLSSMRPQRRRLEQKNEDKDETYVVSADIIFVAPGAKPVDRLVYALHNLSERPVSRIWTWPATNETANSDVELKITVAPNGRIKIGEILSPL